jgi:hypothetical protein
MKYILLFWSSLAFIFSTLAQNQPAMNSFGYEFQHKLNQIESKKIALDQKFIEDFDLLKINGEYYIGIAAIVDSEKFSVSAF